MQKTRTRATFVDRLLPGAVVTGTGPSGDFEDGPRTLVSRTAAPEHAVQAPAWRLLWADGSENVYYGFVTVTVAK
jgi:hypothetical protein